MSLVHTTPVIRKFALIFAYWMGHVVHRMQTSDPDFKTVEDVAKELERYAQTYTEALENNWAALAEAARNVRLEAVCTRAAAASASAMRDLVEGNKPAAAHHAAKAWMLGVKSIPVNERRVNEAAALEGGLFLAITEDSDAAGQMFESRKRVP